MNDTHPTTPYRPVDPTAVAPTTELPAAAPAPAPRGRGGLIAGAIALALFSGTVGGLAATYLGPQATTQPTNSLTQPSSASESAPAPAGSVQEVATKVVPSVVAIEVLSDRGGVQGSGVILSSDGLIITNNHVIAGAQQIRVQLNDGRSFPAEIVATDGTTDIGLIQASGARDLTPIALGNSAAVAVGEQVVAVGNPLGLSGTVTEGIISAKNRPVRAGGEQGNPETVVAAIQTDAAINPGNSGGALVNMKGELIGINSEIVSMPTAQGNAGSIGLGFAIPVNQARMFAEQLQRDGYVTFAALGVQLPRQYRLDVEGVPIADVVPGGAADAAGLRSGEIITALDGVPMPSSDALIAAIRAHAPGDEVTLTVTSPRGGSPREVQATLQAQPMR